MKSILLISESILDACLVKLIVSGLKIKTNVHHIAQPKNVFPAKRKQSHDLVIINQATRNSVLPDKATLLNQGPCLYLLFEKSRQYKNQLIKPFNEETLRSTILLLLKKKK